mmetsp:Transcript_11732/g.17770  ORF Transcript_11732/g.17770 Transcript_11732/m.17770 type:complete len:440 (+) Transcript_11732:122-1441(+)
MTILSCYLVVTSLAFLCCTYCTDVAPNARDHAVVTLIMGQNSGYTAGALALGQSLLDVGSKLSRIAMVTPEVEDFNRNSLSRLWKVVEVEPIYCNHKLDPSISATEFDLQGEQYVAGITRWKSTCTKFAAWRLTQFKRVVFMDSDTIVLHPIDDVLFSFSNASLAAAPETFPPDTFNSGFLVLNPSEETFMRLLELNQVVGSAEGGDQGVLNNGLCPHWYTADAGDLECGKLPWIFNVEAANFVQYQTLRRMSGLRLPAVAHFVSDGKPWKVVAMEYLNISIPDHTQAELKKQEFVHVFWRLEFFKATGDTPPATSSFGPEVDKLFVRGGWRGGATGTMGLIEKFGLLLQNDRVQKSVLTSAEKNNLIVEDEEYAPQVLTGKRKRRMSEYVNQRSGSSRFSGEEMKKHRRTQPKWNKRHSTSARPITRRRRLSARLEEL